jgi:hypothetical protein
MPSILETHYFRISMRKNAWGTIRPEIAHALSDLEMTVLEFWLDACQACHFERILNQKATLNQISYDPLGFEVKGILS